MKLHWLAVLGCLSALAAGHPLSDPTQDTLVVAKSEDTSTEPQIVSSTEPEVTTEGSIPPIKLTEMEVTSEVSYRYAHTVVVARVKNPANKAQEANFRVLLPETAFISGFVMTLDGKSYKAYVKEKEEAKQIYDQAVSQGIGAAHVEAKARDSNQFVVTVNVEALTTAVFNLTYEELLIRRVGVYNLAYNMHPGALVPKFSVTVHIKESQKITDLRVPEVRTGNEIDATKDDAQNTKAVVERGHDDREATIRFSPDLEEQKRLMDIYAVKSKESGSNTHRYTGQEDGENQAVGVLGQFVVQYDVERPEDGEILVNDGYFVHFFAPSDLPPLHKYVVFVLDTSGSMTDRKIVQLREAMQTILSDLNPGDFFSIVEFSSSVTIHDLKEADQEPPKRNYYNYYQNEYGKKPELVAPSPATPENIAKAKVIVSRLDASGGTNIGDALDVAVNLIHKRTEWGNQKPKDNSTEATTTEVAPVEVNVADLYDIERMKTLEPIIIFLTDGDPTVGETNTVVIINRLTEKNFGEDKATIFSLAFGEDADRKFLRKLSLRNAGFMRHIYEAADAALQLQDFYRRVSSPLLAHVKFTYQENQVMESSLTKNKFRTYYAGSEVVVAGRVAEDASEISAKVLGFCGVQDGVGKRRFEKLPKAPVPAKKLEFLPLERLWSYLTIKQLLDQKDASDDDQDKEDSPKKKALALALKYEFVTPLTSLVVVKPNASHAVNAESVDKPTQQISSGHYLAYPSSALAGGSAASYYPPVYSSQALSLDSAVIENEYYEIEQEEQGVSAPHSYMSYSNHRSSYPSNFGFSASSHSYPSSIRHHASYPVNLGWGLPNSKIATNMGIRLDSYPIAPLSTTPAWPTTALPTTALPSSTTAELSSTTIEPAPLRPLEPYHLQDYNWAEGLLNATADALVLLDNGNNLVLKLTKDIHAPKATGGDAACEQAVGGGAGRCVYLTRCAPAKHITLDTYRTAHCTLDGFAGVCCSEKDIDKEDTSN